MFSPDDFRLGFTTAVTPALELDDLVEAARSNGYQGIELVMPAPDGEAHAHGIGPDMSPPRMAEVHRAFADAGLGVSCVATALSLDAEDAAALVEDLKRYVTLAETLGAGCVRVFGGRILGTGEVAGAVDAVADALSDAVAFAEQTSVSVLLETCGDFANTKYVREVVKQVYSDHFGVLWDVVEPFKALETMEEAYDHLAGQVRHVHVQDFRYVDGRAKTEPVMLGEGVVPVAQAVKYLAHDGFEGYLSLETELGPPDEVLAASAKALHDFITEAFPEPVEAE
jgi:sugar phosphate isomerase/epimerase